MTSFSDLFANDDDTAIFNELGDDLTVISTGVTIKVEFEDTELHDDFGDDGGIENPIVNVMIKDATLFNEYYIGDIEVQCLGKNYVVHDMKPIDQRLVQLELKSI